MKKWIRKDTSAALMFLAPSGVGFALFYLIPFAMGVFYSFMDSTVDGQFVGLDNYRELLASNSFRQAASNTFYFSAVSVPLMLVLSLGLAMLLNKNIYFRKWLRTVFVLPLVVPVASIILIWQMLFDWNGSLNAWLSYFGSERVDWMKTDAARNVVIIVYLWKNIGYNVILFLAGLQQIPKDYYETAQIEGAGRLRQFRSITLVYLTSTMFFVVIMSIINSFKVFRETYLIAGDYPHDSIYMMQHYMNNMFMSLDIQKLTAAATLMFGCIFLIVMGLFAIERRHRQFME
ncbi:carbohydrate ABC transporter permease [Paenibacillus macquariensis]|uniref:Carbohydrate ABC transporter membrane protein 1, CUT1 family n=1 Tax=Paenibacillus macquariensis TaxID=948756 RepID=A0ABY1KAN6_9BACL|nr:sugar ABC transporter permease [Paenibacillus macquariensis]MEC0093669.1 sugar ABC transporter permease [Paenibacillus macquariensis]OAB31622.1 sugar ABC transporter permease [Paenibacillus macquariensis subsp. macquariensis]SIR51225.1 carbohydrate ABC transporter membrane protein 1, CUT1 family [Paenibacillus macquariensis]